MFGWGLAAAALEPKETAAAIVAIVVIHERRIRSAPPMTRKKRFGHCDFIGYYGRVGQGVTWRKSISNGGRRSVKRSGRGPGRSSLQQPQPCSPSAPGLP